MPEKPKSPVGNPDDLNDLDAGWSEDDSGVSDRPTVAPPFDLATYAKESAAPSSNVVLKIERMPSIPSGLGIPTPYAGTPRVPAGGPESSLEDRIDQMFSDEHTAARNPSLRARSDTAVTMPPPAPIPEHITGRLTPRLTPESGGTDVRISEQASAPSSEPMSRRETPRGLEQVEQARALSAREDIGTGTALSIANLRAPSNVPPKPETDDPVLTLEGVVDMRASSADITTDPVGEMQERFALGDYSGALVMAESLLDENPTHVEAREYAESCRAVLQQMYSAKIGPMDRVPVVEVAREQLRWLSIDHRAGFVLSLVDGVSSLEMILDVSGMPSLDALRILYELTQQHIIAFKD